MDQATPAPSGDQLKGLYLAAKRLIDGLYAGRHASPMRGAGIEFHDYRPYTPGDDLRSVDWKRAGRTDRYYVKRYRRETDLNLHLAVDHSASMAFAALEPKTRNPTTPTKFAVAQQLAAALATLAIRQGDRAGLSLLGRRLDSLHPAAGSVAALQSMLADLASQSPALGVADPAASLHQLAKVLGQNKATIALISDLLDPPQPVLDAIDRLTFAGHEVVVFQVLAPDELSLPTQAGAYRLTDPEAGATVKTQPRRVAQQYNQLIREHLAMLDRSLRSRGIDRVEVRTDRPLIDTLRRYLIHRAAR